MTCLDVTLILARKRVHLHYRRLCAHACGSVGAVPLLTLGFARHLSLASPIATGAVVTGGWWWWSGAGVWGG
jgi:hypothetical protein